MLREVGSSSNNSFSGPTSHYTPVTDAGYLLLYGPVALAPAPTVSKGVAQHQREGTFLCQAHQWACPKVLPAGSDRA